MSSLYQYVIEKTASGSMDRAIGVEILKQLKREEKPKAQQDIAIIGMAVDMPHAADLDQFWTHLRQGVDCVAPFPDKRKADLAALWQDGPLSNAAPEFVDAAYLPSIAHFDPSLFNITPVEAKLMDPQQRLFLQTAWRALADAGYGGQQLSKSQTGVYVGFSSDFSDAYQDLIAALNPDQLPLSVTGNIASIIASRISYCLNLKGPAMLVDTACSSGLVAIHQAALGLRSGDCETAIVGGVKLNMLPLKEKAHPLGIASASNRTRTFDDGSDGTGFGEGAAALLLKPLEAARKDGDRIYAVIKGSAVNQDGSSSGISAPNALAQEEVLVRAWKDAGIEPETIRYLEAHGTGTKLGDPIEIDGISKAFARFTDKKQFCAIGSVKSNVGHLDHLAGLAGLVKAVLAMRHGEIPPSLHFRRPNRNIPFENSPVFVSDRLMPWTGEATARRCGVSSFGLSGTNCHVVLEEAPPGAAEQQDISAAERPRLMTLSAKSEETLRELVNSYRFFAGGKGGGKLDLDDFVYSVNTGRGQYSHRLALLFSSFAELHGQLTRLARTSDWSALDGEGVHYGEIRIVSMQKTDRQPGELTEADKRRLTAQAAALPAGDDRLAEWARLYISGANVDWPAYYRGRKLSKIELPPEPLPVKRFWVEAAAGKAQSPSSAVQTNAKPLYAFIDRQLADTMNLRIYASEFRFDERWVLSEHRIGSNGFVPGTTYLDMLRQLSLRLYPGKASRLEQVAFLSPLIVAEGEARDMHLFLEEEAEAQFRFTVLSRSEGERDWAKHCEGRLIPAESASERTLSLPAVLERFAGVDPIEVREQHQGEIQFGQRWHNVKTIRVNGKEVLAALELPQALAGDMAVHELHPAMLDNAMNMAINQIGEGLYLPWMYQKLGVYGTMPQTFFSLISLKQEIRPDAETAVFDVVMFDEAGRVFAEAEDYVIKKVNRHGAVYNKLRTTDAFRLHWVPEPFAPPAETAALKPSAVDLVISDGGQAAASLAARFAEAGSSVVEVRLGGEFGESAPGRFTVSACFDDFERLLQAVDRERIGRIVYALKAREAAAADAGQLADLRKASVEGLFALVQTLVQSKISQKLDIILLAPNAQRISGQEISLEPMFAALFGLGKVIHEEYPNFRVRCIDHDETTPADALWQEIAAPASVYGVGYRSGVRYVPELAQLEQPEQDETDIAPPQLGSEGFYLITGGLGGLGLEIGKHFAASQPGIKLAFLSRTPLPPRDEWDELAAAGSGRLARAIRAHLEMERSGAVISVCAADVSSPEQLEQALRELRERFGKVRGIVHAAGVAGKGYLFNKSLADFRHVLAPKIDGTWLLDRLTAADNPDFFVLFSSVTALTGGVGQGDYTAANAYLDAFAAERALRGKRTLAINWPAWKETGMAVDHNVAETGIMQAIRTSSALQMLDRFLMSSASQVLPGSLRGEAAPTLAGSFYFRLEEELARKLAKQSAGRERRSQQAERVFAEVEMKGKPAYTETEVKLAQIWAGVMELEQINVFDEFYSLGGDSILAVRIVSAAADQLNVTLGVTELLDHATIAALASYVDAQLGREPQMVQAAGAAAGNGAGDQTAAEPAAAASESAAAAQLRDQALIPLSTFERVQELSWRQLNCYDRGFAIQFDDADGPLIPLFKLFLGMKRGYDLTGEGYPFVLADQDMIFDYVTDHQLLAKFGYAVRQVEVADPADMHETICRLVQANKPVLVVFDEYYTFYSQFYLKEHTTHLTVINGYDRKKKTYAIINHNHLQVKASALVSYGPFTAPFAALEEIYRDLSEASRIILVLDRLPDAAPDWAGLRNELLGHLRKLAAEEQIGNDIEFMTNWETFRTGVVDHKMKELYSMLGGKELLVDTLVRDFIAEPHREEAKQAADAIAQSSAQFVNKFLTAMLRNRSVPAEELAQLRSSMQSHTRKLFDAAVQALEQAAGPQEPQTSREA